MVAAKPAIPSQAAVLAAWGQRLQGGRVFAKTAKIHAKCAAASGTLETIIKGQKETSKAYRPGPVCLSLSERRRLLTLYLAMAARIWVLSFTLDTLVRACK